MSKGSIFWRANKNSVALGSVSDGVTVTCLNLAQVTPGSNPGRTTLANYLSIFIYNAKKHSSDIL